MASMRFIAIVALIVAFIALISIPTQSEASVSPPLARLMGHGSGSGDSSSSSSSNDDSDDHDNGHGNDERRENARLAAEYRALQANSQRSIDALKALYNTSLLANCRRYVDALTHSDGHLEELLAPLVTKTAKGRIHPLGFFNGSANLVEYFMLACTGGSAVLKVNFRHIQAVNDLVFFDVDFWMGASANPTVYLSNLTHVGWARVNPQGQICALKANFQRLEINDRTVPPLAGYPAMLASHNATIYSTCTQVQQRCTGANQQYADVQSCWNYVSTISGGGYAKGDQASLQCVQLHLILTQFRPDVHCMHVGPTGGGKCVSHPQPGFYTLDEELHC